MSAQQPFVAGDAERYICDVAEFYSSADHELALVKELDSLREQLRLAHERNVKLEARAVKAENLYVRLKSRRKASDDPAA